MSSRAPSRSQVKAVALYYVHEAMHEAQNELAEVAGSLASDVVEEIMRLGSSGPFGPDVLR